MFYYNTCFVFKLNLFYLILQFFYITFCFIWHTRNLDLIIKYPSNKQNLISKLFMNYERFNNWVKSVFSLNHWYLSYFYWLCTKQFCNNKGNSSAGCSGIYQPEPDLLVCKYTLFKHTTKIREIKQDTLFFNLFYYYLVLFVFNFCFACFYHVWYIFDEFIFTWNFRTIL